jgi:tetratricopeptide (TPR) repeat protein
MPGAAPKAAGELRRRRWRDRDSDSPVRWPWWVAAAGVLALGVLLALHKPLSERLWPQTRTQGLLDQAENALAHGRLSAADGSGARELYEAALAQDPDRAEARAGLARVADAALRAASGALERGQFAQAHQWLRLARELAAPRAQLDAVAEDLRRREAVDAGIGGLLARADAARQRGELDGGPDAALPLYARILALQPDETGALEGREDAIADLLAEARLVLADDRIDAAADMVRRARGYDPGHVDLPETRALLVQAAEQRREAADDALARGDLDAALAGYREAFLANPEDIDAGRGSERVAAAWARRSERFASDFLFAPAAQALARASAIAPDLAAVRDAEAHLQRLRAQQARLTPARAGGARVRMLLDDAASAQERGDWLTPPGASAFDHFSAARAIAPGDPEVARAGQRLLAGAVDCFERELRGNRLVRAGDCLQARRQFGDDVEKLRDAQRSLALRWIAVGDERLGAGELDNARRALSAARALDPEAPGLRDFAARVAASGGAGP